MAEFANWNGHSFIVDAHTIRSFTGLTITGSQETEDKTSDKQKYIAAKHSNPIEMTMTVELNAHLGCDVQAEAFAFVEDARSGKSGYFYMGGKKLVNCPLMLISAQISETVIIANAKWTRCKVALTLKQCDKYAGSGASGTSGTGSSGSGSSTTKQSVKVSTSLIQTAIDMGKTIVSNATSNAKNSGLAEAKQISAAITAANAVKTSAQAASKAIKKITTTTPPKGTAGGKMTMMSK